MARMQATHDRRRISIFSGPPGIGKTTAVDAFRAAQPDGVVVAKVSRRHAREVLALQHVLECVRALAGSGSDILSNSVWKLRADLHQALCQWADVDPAKAKASMAADESLPRLTIVFDEAQNLSRQAIDALRYWNDTDRCYSPFPLGLIFVGNSEFSLEVDSLGQSVISAAVADRALYAQLTRIGSRAFPREVKSLSALGPRHICGSTGMILSPKAPHLTSDRGRKRSLEQCPPADPPVDALKVVFPGRDQCLQPSLLSGH